MRHTAPLNSSGFACAPVAAPVMMIPSERKNSAARAVSSMLTSEVRAWELWKDTHNHNARIRQQQNSTLFWLSRSDVTSYMCCVWNSLNHNENGVILWCTSWCSGWFCPSCWSSYLCFFFISVKIMTWPAPMLLRYLSKRPAQASRRPSSATCEKTKPSALIKSRPVSR